MTSKVGSFGDKPAVLINRSGSSLTTTLRELRQSGDLLYFLIWRDIKVRYKQTSIGAAWAILQPLLTMTIFSVVFSSFAKVPSDGVPYPIFVYAGLLPWSYFAAAVSRGGNSLVGSGNLITKVYFPRLIIPLAAVLSPLLDFLVASVLLGGLMVWFHVWPTPALLLMPLFLLLCILTALALSLWLSALCVRFRDVAVVIPFMVQIWLYLSPVAYPARLVPDRWRLLYNLNPMTGVVEGFRWGFLGGAKPDPVSLLCSSAIVLAVLCGGLVYFNRVERVFADVV